MVPTASSTALVWMLSLPTRVPTTAEFLLTTAIWLGALFYLLSLGLAYALS